jgi:hypothetical protein
VPDSISSSDHLLANSKIVGKPSLDIRLRKDRP